MSCWPDKVYLFTASVLGGSMYSLLSWYVLLLLCMFAHTCRGHWTYMAAPSWLPKGLFYPCIWSGLSYLVCISAFLCIFDWWICIHYFPNNFFFKSSCVLLPKHIRLNKHVHFRKHIYQGFKGFGSGLLGSRCFQVFNSRPIPKRELTQWTHAGEVVEKRSAFTTESYHLVLCAVVKSFIFKTLLHSGHFKLST